MICPPFLSIPKTGATGAVDENDHRRIEGMGGKFLGFEDTVDKTDAVEEVDHRRIEGMGSKVLGRNEKMWPNSVVGNVLTRARSRAGNVGVNAIMVGEGHSAHCENIGGP